MQKKSQMQPKENTINFSQTYRSARRDISLVPRSLNQEKLILCLLDPSQHIVVIGGPAGTGKTYLAMLAAVKALKEQSCDRIVLTRPAVTVEDERHGFLPGTLNDKMEPWTRPLLDVLREYYKPQEIANMIDDGIIEISPMAFMRGRTFKNSWIIADEMQNATPSQMKMLMTRIGENSKIIITGDIEQTDRARKENGLIDLCERLTSFSVKGISVCSLGARDVQRHHIIGNVLELYSEKN